MRGLVASALVAVMTLSACTSAGNPETRSSPTTTVATPTTSTPVSGSDTGPGWTEEAISFPFGSSELHGIMTLPTGAAPHPAVVLLSGSGDADGVRAGASSELLVSHSRRLASEGFVVLRYDPPGVGQSTGESNIPSIQDRVDETHAAIQYVQSVDPVDDDRIGLQGWSQGSWVMAMTAVRYPEDVAFLVSVAGSGQSVADQQVYGIGAQTEAAGLSSDDAAKAVLMGRLLIDWQLPEPKFKEANRFVIGALGSGPWDDLANLVYDARDVDPVAGLRIVIEILESVRDEPWANALYPDLFLLRLRSISSDVTPEDLAALQMTMAASLMTDPKDFLTKVEVPIIAFFGENDITVDSETSAELFDDYLADAGNDDYRIVILPNVGHNIDLSTPGYWDELSLWLVSRFG